MSFDTFIAERANVLRGVLNMIEWLTSVVVVLTIAFLISHRSVPIIFILVVLLTIISIVIYIVSKKMKFKIRKDINSFLEDDNACEILGIEELLKIANKHFYPVILNMVMVFVCVFQFNTLFYGATFGIGYFLVVVWVASESFGKLLSFFAKVFRLIKKEISTWLC